MNMKIKNFKKLSLVFSFCVTFSLILNNFGILNVLAYNSGGNFNKINPPFKEIKSFSPSSQIIQKYKRDFHTHKGKDYVEGEVLVKFKKDKINLKTPLAKSAVNEFSWRKSLEKKEDLPFINVSVFKIKDGKTVEEKIAELNKDPNVEYAEPNYLRYPTEFVTPTDPYWNLLWALNNTGQKVNGVSGKPDADIDAPEAWQISEGTTSEVVVAVIDTGVAYNHPDLIENMWNGTNCTGTDLFGNPISGGCNHGYDFQDNDNTPLDDFVLEYYFGHGTHIAGTIAAVMNNEKGIVGVAPHAKIMALKFGFDVASEVRAIQFAIDNGAKIINASFGSYGSSTAEYEAIKAFRNAGGLFIAAAGNDFINNDEYPFYPCAYDLDNIICVAATDQNDNLADFSNYGSMTVDVGAPGVNIFSAVPSSTISIEDFEEVENPPELPSGFIGEGNWGTYKYEYTNPDGSTSTNTILIGDVSYLSQNIWAYASSSNYTVTSPINLNNLGGAYIGFWTVCDTEYTDPYATNTTSDYMALEFSGDGGNSWTEIIRWNEYFLDVDNDPNNNLNGFVERWLSFRIPSEFLTSNFQYRFRWVTNEVDNDHFGCGIDDIEIIKGSDGSDEHYRFWEGTSMATPHVVGLAALIWGTRPDLTYSQVKDIILNTGDSLDSLAGKTVTGKRINAYNALDSITPPIISNIQVASTTETSTIITWITNEPATSKVVYSTSSNFVSSLSVSSTELTTNHQIELTDLSKDTIYYFYVESEDRYNNVSTSTIYSFLTDITPPTIISFIIPATSTTSTISVTLEATDTAGIAGYLLTEASTTPALDDPNWSTTTPTSYTFDSEGIKTLYAWVKDIANHLASTSSSVIIDWTPPTIQGLSDDTTPKQSKTWKWSATDNITATSSILFRYLIDQSSTSTPAGTYSTATEATQPSGDGIFYLHVQAKDEVGNESEIVTVSAVLDNTPPTATLSNLPSNPTTETSINITVGGTDVVYYKYKLDQGNYSNELSTTTPIALSGLSVGSHTICVIGRDIAENWQKEENATCYSWTINPVSSGGGGGFVGGGGGGGGPAPTPPSTKKGDVNGDNKVDKYDFALMMANWGKTGPNICDLNGDNKVDKYDFALLMLNWTG
jgi:subtilisin family serine protease